MKDINRIKVVLNLIEKIWTKYPDLRFFQMLELIKKEPDSFYLEDEELIKILKERGDSNCDRS